MMSDIVRIMSFVSLLLPPPGQQTGLSNRTLYAKTLLRCLRHLGRVRHWLFTVRHKFLLSGRQHICVTFRLLSYKALCPAFFVAQPSLSTALNSPLKPLLWSLTGWFSSLLSTTKTSDLCGCALLPNSFWLGTKPSGLWNRFSVPLTSQSWTIFRTGLAIHSLCNGFVQTLALAQLFLLTSSRYNRLLPNVSKF